MGTKVVDRSTLPRGLASPPWRVRGGAGKRSKPELLVCELEQLPYEPHIDASRIDTDTYWEEVSAWHDASEFSPRTQRKIVKAIRADWSRFGQLGPLTRENLGKLLVEMPLAVFLKLSRDSVDDLLFAAPESLADKLPAYVNKHIRGGARVDYITLVVDPKLAVQLAKWCHTASYRGRAKQWMFEHPRAATIGLAPAILALRPGKARAKLLRPLAELHEDRDTCDEVEAVLEEYGISWTELSGEPDPEGVDIEDDLAYRQHPERMPKLPKWLRPAKLPRLLLDTRPKRALGPEVVEDVLLMFSFSREMQAPYIGLEELSDVVEPRSGDAFAVALLEAWLDAGALNKDAWVVSVYMRLSPRPLPPKLLSLLEGLFDNGKQKRGRELLTLLAKHPPKPKTIQPLLFLARTGRESLRDAVDEVLRSYAGHYTLRAVDRLGDAHVEAAAPSEVDPHTLQLARFRLEEAMTRPRRWTVAHWQEAIAEHPLMGELARGLVWGTYSRKKLLASFTLDARGRPRGLNRRAPLLGKGVKIGIVHPMQLEDEQRRRWRARLEKSSIVSPFPQLERHVELPARLHGERPESYRALFAPFMNETINAKQLARLLERGWFRGNTNKSHLRELWFGNAWNSDTGAWVEIKLELAPGLSSDLLTGTRAAKGRAAIVGVSVEHPDRSDLRRFMHDAVATLGEVLRCR